MADPPAIFNSDETKNWFSACMATRCTRSALHGLIATGGQSLQTQLIQNVITTHNLPMGTTCQDCPTAVLGAISCPTKGICRKEKGKCRFHTDKVRSCQKGFCNPLSREIKAQHRFNGPSWGNTHADRWSSNYFDILKCFTPTEGYEDKNSIEDTDINGLLSIIINCTWFQQFIGDDLSKDCSNFKKAKDVTTNLRHNAEFKLTRDQLECVNDVLSSLLVDSKYLANDPKAKEALDTIKKLQNESLAVTMVDVNAIMEEMKEFRSKEDMIKTMTQEAIEKISLATEEKVKETRTKLLEMSAQCLGKVHAGFGENIDNTTDTYTRLKKEFTGNLISFYKEERCVVPMAPLKAKFDEDLTKVFSQPKLSYQTKQAVGLPGCQSTKGLPLTKYKDIFYKDGKKLRNIYMTGAVGMGKSTFCSHMTSDWCDIQRADKNRPSSQGLLQYQPASPETGEQHNKHQAQEQLGSAVPFSDTEILLQFDFVFPVILRAAKQQGTNLEALIEKQIISMVERGNEHDAAFIKRIMYEEKCLILIDGLDEWPHSIPDRVFRKNWTYITTTRPWKMAKVPLSESKIDVGICIEGIIDPNELITKAFGCLNALYSRNTGTRSERSARAFLGAIKEGGLERLLDVPVVLMHLITLWFEVGKWSQSKCEIYASTLEMLLKRTVLDKRERHPEGKPTVETTHMPKCFSKTQTAHCVAHWDLVESLSNLAYTTLTLEEQSSSVVFDKYIVDKHISETECKTALETGILSQSEVISLQDEVSTFNFLRKTFQEFLCAVYIATRNAEGVNKCVDDLFNTFGKSVDVRDISEVLVFVCGMNPKIGVMMSNHISAPMAAIINSIFSDNTDGYGTYWSCLNCIDTYERMIRSSFFECVNNGYQEPGLSFHHTNIGQIGRSPPIPTASPWDIAKERLLDINTGKLLTLAACVDSPIEDIVTVVKRNPNLTSLSFWGNGLFSSPDTGIDLTGCNRLQHLLCNLTQISYIRFSPDNLVSCRLHGGSKAIEKDVFSNLASGAYLLKTLYIDQCKSPDELMQMLPTVIKLERLWLSWVDIGNRDIYFPNSITNIQFRGVYLSVGSWKNLVDLLTKSSHSVKCEFGWYDKKIKDDFEEMRKYVTDNPRCEQENTHRKEVFPGSYWIDFSFTVRSSL